MTDSVDVSAVSCDVRCDQTGSTLSMILTCAVRVAGVESMRIKVTGVSDLRRHVIIGTFRWYLCVLGLFRSSIEMGL